jgi:all-trans-retinol 13,14-reductase
MWDAIVVGSGIGGLSASAALARHGRSVLLLERHSVAGGLTQTFRRRHWEFAPGVHYIAGVGPQPGPQGQFGRLLAWLTDGELRFAASANPYDIIKLPGFEFGIAHPEQAYRDALLARFPHQQSAIAHWFEACAEARKSAYTLLAMRGMPEWMAFGLRLWHGAEAGHWARHTLADELARIEDARLYAVLGGRWRDYGAAPAQAPFVEHALVMHAYDGGAYYPVGGPARFAQTLVPVIESAGGEVRLSCDVRQIITREGRATAIEYEHDAQLRREEGKHIVSGMGVINTAHCLAPDTAPAWQHTIGTLAAGTPCVSLFIGFEGDIAAAGASSANHWIFENEDIGAKWTRPADEDAPALFVSFPSLKDPSCLGGPTAEVVAGIDPDVFAPWMAHADEERPEDYLALKEWIEDRLLSQFLRHFPALKTLVRFHELATPLTQRHFVHTPEGSMYGIEMSAERLTTPALHVRTPVPGLYLAGQDVMGPGVPAACMGGLLAAAAIEPALWPSLRAH